MGGLLAGFQLQTSLVVQTLSFHRRRHGFDPWSGKVRIPHSAVKKQTDSNRKCRDPLKLHGPQEGSETRLPTSKGVQPEGALGDINSLMGSDEKLQILTARIQIPPVLLVSCVSLGKLFNFLAAVSLSIRWNY